MLPPPPPNPSGSASSSDQDKLFLCSFAFTLPVSLRDTFHMNSTPTLASVWTFNTTDLQTQKHCLGSFLRSAALEQLLKSPQEKKRQGAWTAAITRKHSASCSQAAQNGSAGKDTPQQSLCYKVISVRQQRR